MDIIAMAIKVIIMAATAIASRVDITVTAMVMAMYLVRSSRNLHQTHRPLPKQRRQKELKPMQEQAKTPDTHLARTITVMAAITTVIITAATTIVRVAITTVVPTVRTVRADTRTVPEDITTATMAATTIRTARADITRIVRVAMATVKAAITIRIARADTATARTLITNRTVIITKTAKADITRIVRAETALSPVAERASLRVLNASNTRCRFPILTNRCALISNAGICSRREADEFIQQGLVKVNGVVVTELGTKISHSDVVEYDEKVVTMQSKCYILLNKPKDCVTTSDDPNGRLTVMDIVKGACPERIYPVGRLDRNTTGVLLLTNDGDLASKLTHPKYVKKKIYHVWCDRDISEDDMQRIADGIELEDGPIHADAISYATETDRNQAGIEIHSGRNRIVRRIFESLGYHVTKLDRVYFAGLTKKNLPRGRWRYLTQEEVNYLKMGSFE